MAIDFVMCVRNIKDEAFGNEPASTQYLFVPEGEDPSPKHAQERLAWTEAVVAESTSSHNERGEPLGDLLVFIHGFNTSQSAVMQRHRKLKDDLGQLGFNGGVASFDWPSADSALNYLEDRSDAKKSALQLVTDGIVLFSQYHQKDCRINVHLLAHSMGALVVREAFDDADDRRRLAAANWMTSQIMLIGADISKGSLSETSSSSESLYRHCVRLTNYSNREDAVLALSNVKRAGVAPRAGRHGLPSDAPSHAVNVDCGDYWRTIPSDRDTIGNRRHSWHIGDPVFTKDMLLTIQGVDRNSMPTRAIKDGQLVLRMPA